MRRADVTGTEANDAMLDAGDRGAANIVDVEDANGVVGEAECNDVNEVTGPEENETDVAVDAGIKVMMGLAAIGVAAAETT